VEVHRIVDPFFDANLYLVKSKTAALVDAGTGRGSEDILRAIREGLASTEVTQLILTHRHVDHVAGARTIAEVFGLVPWISVDDAPPLVEGDRASTGASLFGIDLQPLEVKVLSYDGVIDLGDARLEVIHTPGHTIGSICLWCENGSIFTGDTVFAYGAIGRWDLETGSLADLLSSLKRLEALDVENLYPGHGPEVKGNGSEHISMALEMAEAYRS
jgi:glyoxylase-like metal-dependent hydrolase (beta-lactamase superfamily II)